MKKVTKKKATKVRKRKAVKRVRASAGVTVKKRVAKKKINGKKKKQDWIPVGFSILKLRGEPPKARAYDKRNGREVLLGDIKEIPPFVRRELTDDEIAAMLLTKDAKR